MNLCDGSLTSTNGIKKCSNSIYLYHLQTSLFIEICRFESKYVIYVNRLDPKSIIIIFFFFMCLGGEREKNRKLIDRSVFDQSPFLGST